jgi:FTR1 family protein
MITPVSFAMLRMLAMYSKWEARLEARVGGASLEGADRYALFLMAFTATFREGVEAVVFITGVSQANPTAIPIPGVLGLALGSFFSYVVFFGTKPVDIRPFMYVTAFIMFAIGAGLFSRAFHAFQVAGYFGSMGNTLGPDYEDYSYSISEYTGALVVEQPSWVNVPLGHFRGCCAANDSTTNFYTVIRAVFGYADRPTRLEIITYMLYWGAIMVALAHKYRSGTLFGRVPPAGAAGAAAPALAETAAVGDEEMAKLAGGEEVEGKGKAEGKGEGAAQALRQRGAHDAASGDEVTAEATGDVELESHAPAAAAAAGGAAAGGVRGAAAAALASARSLARRRPRAVAGGAAAAATLFALLLGLLLPRPPGGPPVTEFTLVIARNANASLPIAPGKAQITVNGVWPGPTLRAPLGHRVRVTIINALERDEGTAVHWHGMLQRGTPWSDGVVGVSQCPILPVPGANSLVVEFTPDRAGTFWYHGHMGGQYPDGLYGAFIVDDGGASVRAAGAPAFVADDWVWTAADWYNTPVCWPDCDTAMGMGASGAGANGTNLLAWYMSPVSEGLEPVPDAVVVNAALSGQLVYDVRRDAPQRVRIINAAALSMYNVSVDGLPLTVVELDGVAVEPLVVPWVVLNVAQRVSLVLDWSLMHPALAASPAVRFRVRVMSMYADMAMANASDPQPSTASMLAGAPVSFDYDWVGTIAFSPGAVPSYTDGDVPVLATPPPTETNLLAARPWPAHAAPDATQFLALTFGFGNDPDSGVNKGYVNNATYVLAPAAMAVPLLHSFTAHQPLGLPTALIGIITGDAVRPALLPHNRVVEVLLTNLDNGEHPFHLHGHNFWVVDTSAVPDGEARYGPHYVRRDVISLPPSGWARIRFVADNPGVWLFHCHSARPVACLCAAAC